MTPREEGFLLLTSQLGNPDRKTLTAAQLRSLEKMVRRMEIADPSRDLSAADLVAVGCGKELAQRIVALLSEQELLEHYLRQGRKAGCVPLTRVTGGYPVSVRQKLGPESPGCLWARGDVSLLNMPTISLVGSRDLDKDNELFAREVGTQAALQGFCLVSGNARGADRAAQDACLAAGGKVISVIADVLAGRRERENVLYLSEDGYDQPFSAQRAISRNRVIHCLSGKTLVAQCGYQTGGTWDGSVKNLRFGWSPLFVFDDHSPAAQLLIQMGAVGVDFARLKDFSQLKPDMDNFFDQ